MLLTLWTGLVLGSVYALVATGLTMSMLPSGTLNLAQGAVVVAGSYLTYSTLAVHGLSIVVCVAVNLVVGAALGLACELLCVRPLHRGVAVRRQQNELVTTVGFSLALIGTIGLTWGYEVRAVPFFGPTATTQVLGVTVHPVQVLLLAAAAVAALGLHLWARHTRWGRICLAIAEDREASSLRGIDVDLVSLLGFAASGAFGAVTAVLIGPITYATPAAANLLVLGGFVALVLGGRGNFAGVLLGGLVVGVVSSLATRYLGGSFGAIAVLAVLLTALTVRGGQWGMEDVRRV